MEEFHYRTLVARRSLRGFLSQSMIPTTKPVSDDGTVCMERQCNFFLKLFPWSPPAPILLAETPPSFWGGLNPQNSDRKLSLQRVRQDSLMEHSVPGRQSASCSNCGCTHTPCTAPNRIAEWFLQVRHLYLDLCIQSTYQLWKSYFYSCLQIRKLKLDGATTLGTTLPLHDLELDT